ncbi:hypothetical protein EV586_10288 [Tumebacillus sp. BK434]|uniref:lysine 5,6-aminomutase reactivase subunit KamB n=1 Tax=Tumebacillus sp. BK434 TaxID=2512169 RepID=UPI001053B264|nr:hypothetical protein [Tumebacillus sp. BK434]TCP57644.1 hypothetical protein EV586_10288 [Tumebacillus sp. BK434]
MALQRVDLGRVRRLALVGIAKHAGKTTALNELIGQASVHGRKLGLLSIGVDGERNDAIMGVPKPEVRVPAGALVASAGDVLTEGTASLRIVESTGIGSTLGDVYLAEVQEPGTVVLAGVRYQEQVSHVLTRMEALGADLCFIDGAFDRMMAAHPLLTDGVVLATGAVVAKTVQEAAQKSLFFLQRFALPQADAELAMLYDLAAEKGALAVGVLREDRLEPVLLRQTSSFTANPQNDPHWPGQEDVQALAVTGAVTDRLVQMLEGMPRGFRLVLSDATHFFVSLPVWRKFLRRGHRIVVRRSVNVLGVAVNPYAVQGYRLPGRELVAAIQAAAGGIPVFDVKE